MAATKEIAPIVIPGGTYYTTKQIAELRGVSQGTVQYWVKRGWLTVVRLPGAAFLVPIESYEEFARRPLGGPRS